MLLTTVEDDTVDIKVQDTSLISHPLKPIQMIPPSDLRILLIWGVFPIPRLLTQHAQYVTNMIAHSNDYACNTCY